MVLAALWMYIQPYNYATVVTDLMVKQSQLSCFYSNSMKGNWTLYNAAPFPFFEQRNTGQLKSEQPIWKSLYEKEYCQIILAAAAISSVYVG